MIDIDLVILTNVLRGMIRPPEIGIRVHEEHSGSYNSFQLSTRNYQITGRELEVIQLILDGMGNSRMAEHLVISVKTVEAHVNHIAAKLGLAGPVALRHTLIREYYYAIGRRDGSIALKEVTA